MSLIKNNLCGYYTTIGGKKMIESIKEFIKLKKELNREYGIIDVGHDYSGPNLRKRLIAHIDSGKGVKHLISLAKSDQVMVIERDSANFPYEAFFERDGLVFLMLLEPDMHEEIMEIEGVKDE